MTDGEKIGIALGSAAALGIGLWYAYHQGKKADTPVNLPFDVNPSGSTTNQPSDMRNIEVIADRIYRGDSGLNIPWFSEHDEEAYRMALTLSNTDFTQLYNVFNAKYKKNLSETMPKFVQSQWAADDSTYGTLQKSLLDRFASLNLT